MSARCGISTSNSFKVTDFSACAHEGGPLNVLVRRAQMRTEQDFHAKNRPARRLGPRFGRSARAVRSASCKLVARKVQKKTERRGATVLTDGARYRLADLEAKCEALQAEVENMKGRQAIGLRGMLLCRSDSQRRLEAKQRLESPRRDLAEHVTAAQRSCAAAHQAAAASWRHIAWQAEQDRRHAAE